MVYLQCHRLWIELDDSSVWLQSNWYDDKPFGLINSNSSHKLGLPWPCSPNLSSIRKFNPSRGDSTASYAIVCQVRHSMLRSRCRIDDYSTVNVMESSQLLDTMQSQLELLQTITTDSQKQLISTFSAVLNVINCTNATKYQLHCTQSQECGLWASLVGNVSAVWLGIVEMQTPSATPRNPRTEVKLYIFPIVCKQLLSHHGSCSFVNINSLKRWLLVV